MLTKVLVRHYNCSKFEYFKPRFGQISPSSPLPLPHATAPDFVNHSYDYRPNWTPLSPFTIISFF